MHVSCFIMIIFFFISDCVHLEEGYMSGDIFAKGDNCNSCKCMADGTIQCSEKSCFKGKNVFVILDEIIPSLIA